MSQKSDSNLSNSANYGVVLVTASSQAGAERIAHALVEAQLAACVSLMPIQSVYRWQGEIHQDQEWQLVIKTCLEHFPSGSFASLITIIC